MSTKTSCIAQLTETMNPEVKSNHAGKTVEKCFFHVLNNQAVDPLQDFINAQSLSL